MKDKARLLAGGTDLLVNIRNGVMKPALVIDVKKVKGYAGISWSAADGPLIHPATTINDVLQTRTYAIAIPSSPSARTTLPRTRSATGRRSSATSSTLPPAPTWRPPCSAWRRRRSSPPRAGNATVPFQEFFKGVKKTVVQDDEILERIVVPASSAGARGSYRKLKRINGHDLGIVGVALMKKDGLVRLGISSSAPTPVLVDGLKEGDESRRWSKRLPARP